MAVIHSIYKQMVELHRCSEQEFCSTGLKSLFRDISLYESNFNIFYFKYIKRKERFSFINIRNRCLFTGRSRAIIKRLHIGRHIYKKLASGGSIAGVKKATW